MNSMFFSVVLVFHVIVGLAIIGLVLVQHGKGADMGAAFGSGGSGSLFGATGSANFLSRTTAALAAVFFATSLGLSYMASAKPKAGGGVIDAVKTQPTSPAGQPVEPLPVRPGDLPDSKARDIPK